MKESIPHNFLQQILESRKTMDKMIAASPKVTTRRRRRDDEDESEVESETVEQATEDKEPVVFEGVVTSVIKGGVLVACDSVSVFIPASQGNCGGKRRFCRLDRKKSEKRQKAADYRQRSLQCHQRLRKGYILR